MVQSSLFLFFIANTLFGQIWTKNIQNSMVMFTFSVFHQKYRVWVNLEQKIKIVSLN